MKLVCSGSIKVYRKKTFLAVSDNSLGYNINEMPLMILAGSKRNFEIKSLTFLS